MSFPLPIVFPYPPSQLIHETFPTLLSRTKRFKKLRMTPTQENFPVRILCQQSSEKNIFPKLPLTSTNLPSSYGKSILPDNSRICRPKIYYKKLSSHKRTICFLTINSSQERTKYFTYIALKRILTFAL